MLRTTMISAAAIVLLAGGCATKSADTGSTVAASDTATSDTAMTNTAATGATMRSDAVDEFQIPTNLTSAPSGLQYSITQPGSGAVATNGHKVDVHYTGWLKDGTKFDSSRDRGAPFSFVLGQGSVIRGWDEGVAGMKVGEQRYLVIPSSLGYGARGAGGVIPPNADLVFKVELVKVY